MSSITLNYEKTVGKIKIMHAVNNGPVVAGADQTRGNQDQFGIDAEFLEGTDSCQLLPHKKSQTAYGAF